MNAARDFTVLFSPIALGNLTLKNRIVRSATNDYAAESDGSVSPYQIDIIRELAESEVGLIITGNFAVAPEGRNGQDQHALYGDIDEDALTDLVRAGKKDGCAIVAQLGHSGGKARRKNIDAPAPVAPSGKEYFPDEAPPEELTIEGIDGIVNAFADAALRAKRAGFDGVQVHCAHGYLLSQFLSPQDNLRSDDYGGPAKNRFRIVEEIVEAIRTRCGPHFPLLIKLNGNMGENPPSYLEDVGYFVGRCESLGLSAVEISGCDFTAFDRDAGPYYSDIVAELRKTAKIPLIQVGGARSLADMAEALAAGADLVALSRPFICESGLIPRLTGGQEKAKCISCNKCFTLYKNQRTRCVFHKKLRVRALLHLEHEGLGLLRNAFLARGAEITETNLWKGDALPSLGDFDILVVMGGAMNVDEEGLYPWLAPEKRLIRQTIDGGKRVLGICLGAQLIARALGAEVKPMGHKEIGWFPVRAETERHRFFPSLRKGESIGMAHWHGDTFALPDGCERLFTSEACPNQGFAVVGKPVVGLQFHAELDIPMLRSFIEHGEDELAAGGRWVQNPKTALAGLAKEGARAREAQETLVGRLMA